LIERNFLNFGTFQIIQQKLQRRMKMTESLKLPDEGETVREYQLVGTPIARPASPPVFNRIAYAAAHVVSDPFRDADPWNRPQVDWETTMAFRHHLWSLGFKIAEAMDTSQRGMGLDWVGAQELISRSLAEARSVKGADLAAARAPTNSRPLTPARSTMSSPPMRNRSASSKNTAAAPS
jgi:Protein of unknown function (DUF993).